jgi:phosphoribosylaminoimidazolecarboxamide formyltransferase/IMP cyclohydrolase
MSSAFAPRRALLSVSDKKSLVPLAQGLVSLGIDLLASGGTEKALREAGIAVTAVSKFTGAPELLGGRVKTLHPRVHGGILARRGHDEAELEAHGLEPIDIVVVNLYPFSQAAARGVDDDSLIEEIDIGGPTLLRAAAKNSAGVLVLCDPEDYEGALQKLREGTMDLDERRRMARKAFAQTAAYDSAILSELDKRWAQDDALPENLHLSLSRVETLRYGENPHQRAALYSPPGPKLGLAAARQLGGKELSYNNLVDAQGAWRFVADWPGRLTACVVKHASPCGAALADSALSAIREAWNADPLSAFGGIVAFNSELGEAAAEFLTAKDRFFEVLIARSYSEAALERLLKKKNLRVLAISEDAPAARQLRAIDGGVLVQEADRPIQESLNLVCSPQPEQVLSKAREADAAFAIHCVTHVRSNGIAIVRDGVLVGVGGGQPSRVEAVRIALEKAGERARGGTLASDAFFPFPDGVELAASGGLALIVQPGGSLRDAEVTEAARRLGLFMIHTGRRHFYH